MECDEAGAAVISQLAWKSAIVGLMAYGCLLLAMQIFGRYEVESNLHYYWIGFQHWIGNGSRQFIQSIFAY